MYVFIDESGDAGFKVEKGASPIFAAAMVIFADAEAARITQETIARSAARKLHKPREFKFSKCADDVRDAYFDVVRECPFIVRAVVVQKALIYSPRLKADKEKFYNYFIRSMLSYDNDILRNARIAIDGSGDRIFRKNLASEMRRKLGNGKVKSVKFKDSKNDALVQLADMCAGAIARSYRRDRDRPNRWRQKLKPRIGDVWDFH